MSSTGAYFPPQWANTPSQVSITVPPPQQQPDSGQATSAAPLNLVPGYNLRTINTPSQQTTPSPTVYVFDAVLELDHEQRLEKTHHPIQTGADVSSHAYLMPAKCAMYIGMSDAMSSYTRGGATAFSSGNGYGGTGNSRSVNAYQQMLALQASRTPLTVTTRLRTYTNMVVLSISPREDYKTITGLRMRVEFEQIYTASTNTTPTSARPDATQATGQGTVTPTPVPAITQTQFQQPQTTPGQTTTAFPLPPSGPGTADFYGVPPLAVNTPGAGVYSSVPGQQGAAQ